MALCSQTDVEQRLQIDFNNNPEPVITALIEAAQGHIEREYGGPIEAGTYTDEKHTGARKTAIHLRHHPVTAVDSLTEDGDALTDGDDYVWNSDGVVRRVRNGVLRYWPSRKLDAVSVTYDAGYASGDIPEDIRDVCAWMVADAFMRGVTVATGGVGAGVSAESIDGYSVSYIKPEDAEALVAMSPDQRRIIRSYRRRSGYGVA